MWVKSTRTSRYKWAQKQEKAKKKHQAIAKKKFGTKRCPKGYIVRAGYVRNAYTRRGKGGKLIHVKRTIVPPICVKDTGLRGKGPRVVKGKLAKIGPVKRERLKRYGYKLSGKESLVNTRRSALKKAIEDVGRTSTLRMVNAAYVWNKNKNPVVAKKAYHDKEWIKKTYPLKKKGGKTLGIQQLFSPKKK